MDQSPINLELVFSTSERSMQKLENRCVKVTAYSVFEVLYGWLTEPMMSHLKIMTFFVLQVIQKITHLEFLQDSEEDSKEG